jgi:hypothetical protein
MTLEHQASEPRPLFSGGRITAVHLYSIPTGLLLGCQAPFLSSKMTRAASTWNLAYAPAAAIELSRITVATWESVLLPSGQLSISRSTCTDDPSCW